MYFSTLLSVVTAATTAFALPSAGPGKPKPKPPAFFLAGDSTTAIQSTDGGGWGDGFLATLRKDKGSFGINYGHNGFTTVTFKNQGDWSWVLDSVNKYKATHEPYVTIQFGHNDQKVDKNISVAQFEENLTNFVSDVRVAGGTPILVTSLSRRSFSTSTGKIALNLAVQVNATLRVAAATKAAYIDLNKASTDYLNAIGQENAWKYNLLPADRTHLNWVGSVVFGNMVGNLIEESSIRKKVEDYIRLDKKIVKALKKGEFIYPETTPPPAAPSSTPVV